MDTATFENLLKKNWHSSLVNKEIVMQQHPNYPLYVLNYTRETQYSSNWNDVTLNSRGLVIEFDGVQFNEIKVISRCMPKFFNFSELKEGTITPEDLKTATFFEKLDGSYIGVFYYQGEWIVNSRGSFTSDHVGWATELLNTSNLDTQYTYIFELIHPENRVVIDYHDRKELVFLTSIHNLTGEENFKVPSGYTAAKTFQFKDFNIENLKTNIPDDEEGYVIRLANGFKFKLKGENYVTLHKWMTNLTNKDLYEAFEFDMLPALLANLPDEMDKLVKHEIEKYKVSFFNFCNEIFFDFENYTRNGRPPRKEFAMLIKDYKYTGLLFNLYDDKFSLFTKNILKIMRPTKVEVLCSYMNK